MTDFRRVVLCSVEMEVLSTEIEPLEPAGPVVFTFAVRNSRGRQKVRGAALVRVSKVRRPPLHTCQCTVTLLFKH